MARSALAAHLLVMVFAVLIMGAVSMPTLQILLENFTTGELYVTDQTDINGKPISVGCKSGTVIGLYQSCKDQYYVEHYGENITLSYTLSGLGPMMFRYTWNPDQYGALPDVFISLAHDMPTNSSASVSSDGQYATACAIVCDPSIESCNFCL
eukprot:TRINITY_DN21277_c0_g1_i1.p1 TRINITY_DN21277_c0_g1~~TRINITY_DN21277_c0_g1_i1.p1  ORF type:complete len:153 (-),score=22.01 TRINITY_DN21277_c0_g1_i1:95-553(-)